MNEYHEEANAQVNAFLDVIKSRYGLDDSDVSELLQQLVRLQKRSKFAERMGEWFAKSVITIFVGAFFSGLYWVIIQFIKELKT